MERHGREEKQSPKSSRLALHYTAIEQQPIHYTQSYYNACILPAGPSPSTTSSLLSTGTNAMQPVSYKLPGHSPLPTLPQQHIKGTPIQTLHQNPIQGNTQNPFQPLVQTQNNLMYYNPFGTSQTLHPQSQNKYNISLEKNGSKKKKVLYQEAYSLSSHSQKVATSINNTKLQCLMAYGFYANPKFTLQKNFNNMLNNSVAPPQYLQPKNLAFHNLCKLNKLPTGSKVLLGLNLKFCLANKMITNDISKTMLHMARSIPNKSSSKREWSYR